MVFASSSDVTTQRRTKDGQLDKSTTTVKTKTKGKPVSQTFDNTDRAVLPRPTFREVPVQVTRNDARALQALPPPASQPSAVSQRRGRQRRNRGRRNGIGGGDDSDSDPDGGGLERGQDNPPSQRSRGPVSAFSPYGTAWGFSNRWIEDEEEEEEEEERLGSGRLELIQRRRLQNREQGLLLRQCWARVARILGQTIESDPKLLAEVSEQVNALDDYKSLDMVIIKAKDLRGYYASDVEGFFHPKG
ncbi:hypothetical protein PG994_007071 [Apiospora phragmitis]|uniref:Uncharacterized protein n=1 Tax=Apiospora phragmitis TaxID=2905665 RepID=A0ABR1UZV2_9PEZI